MIWVYERDNMLLRRAPWADMALVREPLIVKCEAIVEQRALLPSMVDGLQQFKDGTSPTLPFSVHFENALYDIIIRVFDEFSTDCRWGDATREMQKYFFQPRHWISQE